MSDKDSTKPFENQDTNPLELIQIKIKFIIYIPEIKNNCITYIINQINNSYILI